MYIPAYFREDDQTVQHDFIEQNSFGLFVSQLEGAPFATHLPFALDRQQGPHGELTGHIARANPQWTQFSDQVSLAVFSGPHTYISPTWYQADHMVPTWNYVAVHAYGQAELVSDESELLTILQRTVQFYESALPQPWTFDRSSTFIERMLNQIVGFRIKIERLEGKWKLNQNHPAERRERVAQVLRSQADENSLAIANLMQPES